MSVCDHPWGEIAIVIPTRKYDRQRGNYSYEAHCSCGVVCEVKSYSYVITKGIREQLAKYASRMMGNVSDD